MACFVLFACNRPGPDLGADHQQAVELTETMRLSHAGMEERLDFLKKEGKDFEQQVDAIDNPKDSLKNIVALQDSLVGVFEGMCRQQKQLIDENEGYLKKHERRNLDAAQVAEQHRRVRENYEQLQLQAAAIVQEVENLKIRVDGALLPAHKKQ